ncbi:MAG TPA: AarF/ABC1/UbiB kinase family protein [Actinobacteria bacterium]|nr:AarF/ABC1/UbiB kinase family protein [Actinomycetota bacterium]
MATLSLKAKDLRRFQQILTIAVKHGLGYFIESYGLARYLLLTEKKKFSRPREENFAEQVRLTLEELGPTFIKIGQILSVRPDLIPPEVIFELEKLLDFAPPMDFSVVREVIESELKKEIEDIFDDFEPKPIASASLGQVHKAYLKNGVKVAVKVQRPEAKKIVESDLSLLFSLAEMIKDRIKFTDIVGVVQEFSDSLHRELDYQVEARNADRFRHNFHDDPKIKIPLIFWEYTTTRALTMEFIEGTKISDMTTPELLGIDTTELAEYGAKVFMKQVLVDGFFHADLHPSNIFITPDGKIAYLDFGMVGYVPKEAKEHMARLQFAILKQEPDEIIKETKAIGAEISTEKMAEMKEDLKNILASYYGKSLEDVKINIIGKEFLGLLYEHHIRIPKDYALLAKALITVEGAATTLYPDFNIFETAKPFLYDLIKREYTPGMALEEVYEEMRKYALYLLDYPKQLHEILNQARSGEFQIRYRHVGLEGLYSKLNILAASIIIAAVIIGSAFLATSSRYGVVGIIWFIVAVFLSIWVILAILRSGKS